MTDAVTALATGDFNVRVHVRGKGLYSAEINRFAVNFNQTAEKLGGMEVLRKDFINNFSHEFKTPIVSIKSAAILLQTGALNSSDTNEYLTIIIDESDRLANLATNILELSKIESKTLLTDATNYNFSEEIRKTILLFEHKFSNKNISIALDLDEVSFWGNSMLMKQVWINIIDNATKFSYENSTLKVSLNNIGNMIIVKFQDNGLRMSLETKSRIFDKFYQGDTSHASKGSGLGMTMVKKVIEPHHGCIEIESVLTKGTTTTISFPC